MTAPVAKPAKQDDAAAIARALYDLGPTPVMACKADPRFSYCLYVPKNLGKGGPAPELVVTMHGTGLKIDVAPVLYEGEPDDRGHLVTRTGDRVLTSVTLHKEFLSKRRALAGAEYKEFIRLVKAFVHRAKIEAAASGPELRFKSFLVELIVAHLWDSGWLGKPLAITDYPRAFEQFLAYVVMTELKEPIIFTDYYPASDIEASYDPVQVWDPVNPENNVTRGYTDYDRQRLVQRCSDALDQINIASAATNKTAAVAAWKTLFGPTFPGV